MPVTLRKRKNKDSSITLFLDIYETITNQDGESQKIRKYEFLPDCKLLPIKSPVDRIENKSRLALANKILNERQRQIIADGYGIQQDYRHGVQFLPYFEDYIKGYTKKDIRVFKSCLFKFKEYLSTQKIKDPSSKQITEQLVIGFKEYLDQELNGESPATYFKRFKKFLIHATKNKIFNTNPASNVIIKETKGIAKEILSIDEIQKLAETPCSNQEIKLAFMFTCYTGLRYAEIKPFNWSNIDMDNKRIKLKQSKTGHEVEINLFGFALDLVEQRSISKVSKDALIFNLPSFTTITKTLKKWAKKAGIDRNITYHSARHSFGTNLLDYDPNILYVSKLMGHTSLVYTQRYTHILEARKLSVLEKMPQIQIDIK